LQKKLRKAFLVFFSDPLLFFHRLFNLSNHILRFILILLRPPRIGLEIAQRGADVEQGILTMISPICLMPLICKTLIMVIP